jgi:hypothetical protein
MKFLIFQCFLPHKRARFGDDYTALFLDGHGSHLSYKAAFLAQQNKVSKFISLQVLHDTE